MLIGYEVIGGGIGKHFRGSWAMKDKFVIDRANSGFCYHRVPHPNPIRLPGYEDDCVLADIVESFYIARTVTLGSVRRDPQFKRRTHREWFIDSIGKLRMAWLVFRNIKGTGNAQKTHGKRNLSVLRFRIRIIYLFAYSLGAENQ